MSKEMLEKRTWKEFQENGLLWFTNTILHAFGWAICIDAEGSAFPARCRFRGFSQEMNDNGYERIQKTFIKDEFNDIT